MAAETRELATGVLKLRQIGPATGVGQRGEEGHMSRDRPSGGGGGGFKVGEDGHAVLGVPHQRWQGRRQWRRVGGMRHHMIDL